MLLPRQTTCGQRLVLAYHNVVDSTAAPQGDVSLHMPAANFRRHLALIAREADIVPLSDLVGAPRNDRCRLVSVTFDDAYRSCMTLGMELCAADNVPPTVFVAPGLLGEVPPWDAIAASGNWSNAARDNFLWAQGGVLDYAVATSYSESALDSCRIATERELVESVNRFRGLTLANHTWGHVNLGASSTDRAILELRKAQQWLEARFPRRLLPMASYPYGIAPAHPSAVLLESGITHAFLVKGGWMDSAHAPATHATPRWNVPSGISIGGFQLRLRGWLTGR